MGDHFHENDSLAPVIDWMQDADIVSSRLSIVEVGTNAETRTVRLQVDIDMDDVDTEQQLTSWPSVLPTITEEEEEDDEFLSIDPNEDLPPRRTFPSVLDMHRNTSREQQMLDNLSLLQFLEYDSMDVLVQLMDTVYDDPFHRFVLEKTSSDVIDTVTTVVARAQHGGDTPPNNDDMVVHIITTEPTSNVPSSSQNYDVQVVFSDGWQTYRRVLLRYLEERYLANARDIRQLGEHDFRALLASHRTCVRQRAAETPDVNYEAVWAVLDRVEQSVRGHA